MAAKEVVQKLMDTLNYLVIPVSGAFAIWSTVDISLYVATGVAAANGILQFVKLFVGKDE